MRCIPTELPGVLIIEPDVHQDPRGFFLETYHKDKYRAEGIDGPVEFYLRRIEQLRDGLPQLAWSERV